VHLRMEQGPALNVARRENGAGRQVWRRDQSKWPRTAGGLSMKLRTSLTPRMRSFLDSYDLLTLIQRRLGGKKFLTLTELCPV